MSSLDKDLQKKKESLEEFRDLTKRVLQYIPNIISKTEVKGAYQISSSTIAGTLKYIRPINKDLFIANLNDFEANYIQYITLLSDIKNGRRKFSKEEKLTIDKVTYTMQQSIGAGLDLLVEQNSARKHVGNRFEELIRLIFTEINISNKKTVLQIPYETDEGEKIYKCENDLILSKHKTVKSTSKYLDESEIVVSIKTTSKDRMGKMFIDKLLLEKFVNHNQAVIGIFLNDVQRKENNNISFTLVSGLFMVYTKFLTNLQGIYYLDPPPNANKKPYNNHMSTFSKLVTEDIWTLFSS